jgi:hypothetical protein
MEYSNQRLDNSYIVRGSEQIFFSSAGGNAALQHRKSDLLAAINVLEVEIIKRLVL